MKVLIKEKTNSIVTLAIGKKFYSHWKKYIFPNWKIYCESHNLGLIVFTEDLIDKKNIDWKKPTWQRLLVGSEVQKRLTKVKNVCFLDTDILINPTAPNIFKKIRKNKINITSLRHNLPFEYKSIIRKTVFFRKKYSNKNYPLDSITNCDLKTLYKTSNLKPQKTELCVGVMVFNLKRFSKIMLNWFFSFEKKNMLINQGGCQTPVAYKILSNNYCNLLDYKFQAQWVFEIAARFPHILKRVKNIDLMSDLATSTLLDNYFLHFAGGGPECKVWLKPNFLKKINLKLIQEFHLYYNKKLVGKKIIK